MKTLKNCKIFSSFKINKYTFAISFKILMRFFKYNLKFKWKNKCNLK